MPPTQQNDTSCRESIAADLKRLGVKEGVLLLVHSSLSSLGFVPGGPETVIQGLLEAVGPEGTLLMPALSYEHVVSADPVFDVRNTPSNVGAIAECFRSRPGTIRSLHPTHSVTATGLKAEEILSEHIQDETPCGKHSPFHKLRYLDGRILMLGCGLEPNTSMHGVEEEIEPDYLYDEPLEYRLILDSVRTIKKVYRPHDFKGWKQRYDRLDSLLEEPALSWGSVLEARAALIDSARMWEVAIEALRSDSHFFVEREEHPIKHARDGEP
jgi:aminoglycoside 3-N-acetyltransferase